MTKEEKWDGIPSASQGVIISQVILNYASCTGFKASSDTQQSFA